MLVPATHRSVVYSTEVPGEVKLLPLDEEEFKRGAVKELQAFDDFRVRILPVLGPLPAIFGLNIATAIILDLAGKPLTDTLAIKNRRKLYSALRQNLSEREARWKGQELQSTIGVSTEDIGFVFEDLYGGKSSFAPHVVLAKPGAARWRKDKELMADNLVILSPADVKKHEEECLKGSKSVEEVWGEDKVAQVERKLSEARRIMVWREEC